MKVNINQDVKLKLLPRGVGAFNKYYTDLGLDPKPYWEMAHRNTGSISKKYIQIPLWEAFNIFGPVCYMGPQPPFETNIEIEEQ